MVIYVCKYNGCIVIRRHVDYCLCSAASFFLCSAWHSHRRSYCVPLFCISWLFCYYFCSIANIINSPSKGIAWYCCCVFGKINSCSLTVTIRIISGVILHIINCDLEIISQRFYTRICFLNGNLAFIRSILKVICAVFIFCSAGRSIWTRNIYITVCVSKILLAFYGFTEYLRFYYLINNLCYATCCILREIFELVCPFAISSRYYSCRNRVVICV